MTTRLPYVSLLVILLLACDTGPIPPRRLVPDFPAHRAALATLADALLSLHATEDVSGFFLEEDHHVTFLTNDDHKVDASAVMQGAPDSLKPRVLQIGALAPPIVLGAHVQRDDAVVFETGSGGATGPGWGYVRAGTGGVAKLRQLFQSGLDSIPHETQWFVYLID
jgi:hypothetical protein